MIYHSLLLIFTLLASSSDAFTSPTSRLELISRNNLCLSVVSDEGEGVRLSAVSNDGGQTSPPSSRRDFFTSIGASTLAINLLSTGQALADDGAAKAKVLVLGGSGFVGSQVVETLQELGIATVATSRNGRDGTVALDLTKGDVQARVEKLAQGCTAVISCVGAIGTKDDKAVNAGTAMASAGAKAAGVQRFVYITVAPEVKEFAKGIDFLKGYMEGKTISRDAVLADFGQQAILIEPTFIYGGGSFEVNPPRVASFYGKLIEGLLTTSPVRAFDRFLSPGFIKIAFEPPVPVEAVAGAAVVGALGKAPSSILDTYDKIKEAARVIETE